MSLRKPPPRSAKQRFFGCFERRRVFASTHEPFSPRNVAFEASPGRAIPTRRERKGTRYSPYSVRRLPRREENSAARRVDAREVWERTREG